MANTNVKDREVFALNNFRGLDKENKPLKVASFRASDGKNFIIDSNTLKTRKAVSFDSSFGFTLETNEKILGWYKYREMYLYVTSKYIRIKHEGFNNGKPFSNKSTELIPELLVGLSLQVESLFEGTPFFVEEKDSLFIFGIKKILVFGVIRGGANEALSFVLYELKNKPLAPNGYEFSSQLEELPEAYVPTLYLDNKPYEDINLLSNKVKYKLYAQEKVIDGFVTHKLPTHYKKENHGNIILNNQEEGPLINDFQKVEFYKGIYDMVDTFPVFLGIQGDNFPSGTISSYGSVLSGFYPEIVEEFNSTITQIRDNDTVPNIIKEGYGLDKSVFFRFFVRRGDENITVFEYIMDYIKTLDTSLYTENKVVKFKLNVKYNVIVKDKTTDYVIQELKESKTVDVWVQLKKFDNVNYTFGNEQKTEATLVQQENTTYPSYITPTGYGTPTVTLGNDTPIEKVVLDSNDFRNYALNLISNGAYTVGDKIVVKQRAFSVKTIQQPNTIILRDVAFWETEFGTFSIEAPTYPDTYEGMILYPNSTTKTIYGPYEVITTSAGFSNPLIASYVQSYLLSVIGTLPGTSGSATCKIHIGFKNSSTGIYMTGIAIVPFNYVKATTVYEYTKKSYMLGLTYQAELDNPVLLDLYTLKFNKKDGTFDLKIKDILFDYANEPTIDVTITFPKNADYDLIANTTIGTVFGSENRIFLSGNSNYPNIDRYNVSNDLLGDGVKSQSYESTYFPSKNYRVLGGKGKVNGYVVATDTQLYVTKEEYPNDTKLFVRERVLDDNGKVDYRDYRTSISKTPINDKCVVRYFNDILILAKDGLYAVELSNNILTNERLIKGRDGFVHSELAKDIANFDNSKIFIAADNFFMYIFIGEKVYFIDSRYTATNENNVVENVSYEIVKWELPIKTIQANFFDGKLQITGQNPKNYGVDNKDIFIYKIEDTHSKEYDDVFDDVSKYVYANQNIDGLNHTVFTFNETSFLNSFNGANLSDIIIVFKTTNYVNQRFYIYSKFTNPSYGAGIYYQLSPFKPIEILDHEDFSDYDKFSFVEPNPLPVYVVNVKKIELYWQSSITDFGSNLMEKTSFRVNVYATKQAKENNLAFGYKTMRRLKALDDGTIIQLAKTIDLSNGFDFNQMDFNSFSLNTFNEFGLSIPMKESNFLYMQFMVKGYGQIELNAIEVIYKANRLLKNIG